MVEKTCWCARSWGINLGLFLEWPLKFLSYSKKFPTLACWGKYINYWKLNLLSEHRCAFCPKVWCYTQSGDKLSIGILAELGLTLKICLDRSSRWDHLWVFFTQQWQYSPTIPRSRILWNLKNIFQFDAIMNDFRYYLVFFFSSKNQNLRMNKWRLYSYCPSLVSEKKDPKHLAGMIAIFVHKSLYLIPVYIIIFDLWIRT